MLGNIGRGLRTTRQFTEQVHRLACDLGIKNSDILRHQTVDAGYAGMPCKLCRDYGLLVQEDGFIDGEQIVPAACLAEVPAAAGCAGGKPNRRDRSWRRASSGT